MLCALYRRELERMVVVWQGAMGREGTTTKGELLDGRVTVVDRRREGAMMALGAYSQTELLRVRGQLAQYYKRRQRTDPNDARVALDALAVAECDLEVAP